VSRTAEQLAVSWEICTDRSVTRKSSA